MRLSGVPLEELVLPLYISLVISSLFYFMEIDIYGMILLLTTLIKMIHIVILFLFILILIVNIYGFYRFSVVKSLDNYERRFVTYDTFNTGDVLLVSFENMGKLFVGSIFKIEFLHPALVVKEDGISYVLELMGYKNMQGFIKMKLEEWINRNKSHHIMVNKLETSDENREELARKFLSFTHRYSDGCDKISDVGSFDWSWRRYINPTGPFKSPTIENGKTTCNEFCTKILVESGVVKGDKPLEHYQPDSFIGMKGFTPTEQYLYNEYYLCDLSRFRN